MGGGDREGTSSKLNRTGASTSIETYQNTRTAEILYYYLYSFYDGLITTEFLKALHGI